jgi:hypothetical protein
MASTLTIGGTTINLEQAISQIAPGQVTTIGGIPISFDSSTSFIVVDGTKTIALPQGIFVPTDSAVTIDGITINISQLATQLEAGEVTTIGAVTISRGSSLSALIIGTKTIPLTAAPSALVLGGTSIPVGALPTGFSLIPTTAGGGLLLPNGQKLTPGDVTTVNGMTISLAAGSTPVVVVDNSISITADVITSTNPEDYTYSGIGGTGNQTSTTTGDAAEFTGGAGPNVGIVGGRRDLSALGFMIVMVFPW